MKKLFFTIFICISISILGCGGGGGGSSSSSGFKSTILGGVIVDGYIRGSSVCLDENLNGLCDLGEKSTISNGKGWVSFDEVESKLAVIIASKGVDTATNTTFDSTLKKVVSVNLDISENSFIVSPLTTLVAKDFLGSLDKSLEQLDSSRQKIATILSISADNLDKDPMRDKTTFLASQKVFQISQLLEDFNVTDGFERVVNFEVLDETIFSDLGLSSEQVNYLQNFSQKLLSLKEEDLVDDNLSLYQLIIQNATLLAYKRIEDNNLTEVVPIELNSISLEAPVIKNPIPDIVLNQNETNRTIDLKDVFESPSGASIEKIVLSNTNEDFIRASITGDILTLDYNNSSSNFAEITIRAISNGLSIDDSFRVSLATNDDIDNDYIPSDIEEMLGMNKNSSDQNNNGIVDGLESSQDSISDRFFDKQWFIRSIGSQVNPFKDSLTIEGNDLGVMDIYHSYMGYNKGNPIVVQVVDTGVDASHEDLKQNMDLTLSRNSETASMGDPVETGEHGTMCAGIIGARAFNGVGLRGVAPFAKIAGSNWLGYQSVAELEEVWTKNDPKGKIAISNNSWGNEQADPNTLYEELMEYGAKNLRIFDEKVKGKLFVVAAGNGRENNHDCGLSYMSANPYVITVAALKNDNTFASYSSVGSSLFISGYGGNNFNNSATIATTYVTGKSAPIEELTWSDTKECFIKANGECSFPTWNEDEKRNYTYAMNGTSSAAPTVSGSLALVLEACPWLGWRDIKYIMAKTAKKVDVSNSTWVENSAGFHHSTDYGFGLINPKSMIDTCKGDYKTLPDSVVFSELFEDINKSIPDDNTKSVVHRFSVVQDRAIEWIGLTIFSEHSCGGDLEIYLSSPSGTKTRLMLGNNSGGCYSLADGFRYGSVAFYGEKSAGDWTLEIVDKASGDSGSLQKIKFEVFGY